MRQYDHTPRRPRTEVNANEPPPTMKQAETKNNNTNKPGAAPV
jgi:hypothetical protein